jgi:hypothetical protein
VKVLSALLMLVSFSVFAESITIPTDLTVKLASNPATVDLISESFPVSYSVPITEAHLAELVDKSYPVTQNRTETVDELSTLTRELPLAAIKFQAYVRPASVCIIRSHHGYNDHEEFHIGPRKHDHSLPSTGFTYADFDCHELILVSGIAGLSKELKKATYIGTYTGHLYGRLQIKNGMLTIPQDLGTRLRLTRDRVGTRMSSSALSMKIKLALVGRSAISKVSVLQLSGTSFLRTGTTSRVSSIESTAAMEVKEVSIREDDDRDPSPIVELEEDDQGNGSERK